MRFDCHDGYLDLIIGKTLAASERDLTDPILEKYGNSVKKAQFFASFLENGKPYPFMKGQTAFYPLTIVYKNNKWETAWIKWNTESIPQQFEGYKPYMVNINTHVELCDNDDVDPKFRKVVEGRNLYYPRKKDEVSSCICVRYNPGMEKEIGNINVWFADELCRQISKQIEEIAGEKLNSHWTIEMRHEDKTICRNGISYRTVHLTSFWVCCVPIGVYWKENFQTSDYVTSEDITFHITEDPPGFDVYSFEKLREFISKGGSFF